MSVAVPRNVSASVHQRLLHQARVLGVDPNLILTWYGIERWLYRLSLSDLRDKFVLKGAMLFRLWSGPDSRPTRDLDLLGFVAQEVEALRDAFSFICRTPVEDDGLRFDVASIRVEEIRDGQEYGGLRVSLLGKLGNARVPMQIDVGIGDAVTPRPTLENFPSILEQPQARIRVYPRETVIAEKYDAIVRLGVLNSRMKDYYDLWFLSRSYEFDGQTLADAIEATFRRRKTSVPDDVPVGLRTDFASDAVHARQWAAFISRVGVEDVPSLDGVVEGVRAFLLPPTVAIAAEESFKRRWTKRRWSTA